MSWIGNLIKTKTNQACLTLTKLSNATSHLSACHFHFLCKNELIHPERRKWVREGILQYYKKGINLEITYISKTRVIKQHLRICVSIFH